jgi:hypothetical protein
MMIRTAFGLMASISRAAALSSTVAPMTTRSVGTQAVLEGLKSTPVVRASDEQLVTLPSLWRSNTLAGLGDEVAVTAFLRHYG